MTRLTPRLLLAAALAVSAVTGHAATLGLATEAPAIAGTGEIFHVPGTDLAFIGTTEAGAYISAAAALSAEDGLAPDVAPGALLVDGALSATVAGLGYEIDAGADGGDIIELLLEVEGDEPAASFGNRALAVLTGEFGTDDAFAAAEFFSPARIEISALAVAPIPLPAGGLLLVSGLALIGLRRRAAR